MKLEDAFAKIVDFDRRQLASHLMWQSFRTWPLLRQYLWFALTNSSPERTEVTRIGPLRHGVYYLKRLHRAGAFLKRYWQGMHKYIFELLKRPPRAGDETVAFISRPIYLQRLPNGTLFDRIVDPLIYSLPQGVRYSKYYLTAWPKYAALHYPAYCLSHGHVKRESISADQEAFLKALAAESGLNALRLIEGYAENLGMFVRWYQIGMELFGSRPKLKVVYLPAWYFPYMMGIIAAARELGIRVVEVQHGKQGANQAMYSGWRVPAGGYEMMPDVFWCWGKPSCDHILAGDNLRTKHRPMIGGFPWLDYYRRHVARMHVAPKAGVDLTVLVTTQPKRGANVEPIPDFLIDYIRSNPVGVKLIFRCHPNDLQGLNYCRQRLAGLPASIYSTDSGQSNLYDSLLQATHHVTAYSSCCYEARAFGVPTILFGEDARTIYADEISRGEFAWTPGRLDDFVRWLASPKQEDDAQQMDYIVSSLELASETIGELLKYKDSSSVTVREERG